MTRWLAAAQRASEAGTKPTKPTKLPEPEVLSEKSVLSGGREGLAARLEEARARVARLADADGIARSDAAITAVWDEAEALAAVREAEGNPRPIDLPDLRPEIGGEPSIFARAK